MNIIKLVSISVAILFLSGCAMTASYVPPEHEGTKDKYSVNIQRDFDTVWKELIQYSASTFFAIDNYEKDSGLITLSFGAAKPSDFITGGQWKASSQQMKFDGDYVDYSSIYRKGALSGKMNIVVTSISDTESFVRVSARYVFTTPSASTQYAVVPSHTWSFDTGNCSSIVVSNAASGTGNTRTICPTYKAENAIINALK
jgi:hypothetical protein